MGRHLVILGLIALVAPPVGVPLLLGYLAIKALNHAGRDGGVQTRARYDAWAREEPWWTGDEEADQRRLAELAELRAQRLRAAIDGRLR